MANQDTLFLALLTQGKEIKGKGYFRIEVGPTVAQTVGDVTYEENDNPIRFQKAVEDWGIIDRASIYNERTGQTALQLYSGSVAPRLHPTAGDRLVIPPQGLRIYEDGTLSAEGYITQGEAFTIDRIPFQPIVTHRIHIA